MKKSRFTEEQITYALRQAESGTPVADVCRQLGVSEASFYVWKKKYGKLDLTELRGVTATARRERPPQARGGRSDPG
ncbi:transposase [Thioalkalivibrio sp. XN279]|nr:transposase [Thioalkalivibrio sp. XN279]